MDGGIWPSLTATQWNCVRRKITSIFIEIRQHSAAQIVYETHSARRGKRKQRPGRRAKGSNRWANAGLWTTDEKRKVIWELATHEAAELRSKCDSKRQIEPTGGRGARGRQCHGEEGRASTEQAVTRIAWETCEPPRRPITRPAAAIAPPALAVPALLIPCFSISSL